MARLLADIWYRQWLTFQQTLNGLPLGTNSTQAMAHLLADTQYMQRLPFRHKLDTGNGLPFDRHSMAHFQAEIRHRRQLIYWQKLTTGDGTETQLTFRQTFSGSPLGTNSTQAMAHF